MRVMRLDRLLLLGLMLLGATVNALGAHLQPASVLIAHAQILESQATGFFSPPYTISSEMIAGSWTDVALPRAPHLQLMTDAEHVSDDQAPTTVTWYRMQVRVLDDAKPPLYIYIPRWKSNGMIAVYADSRLLYQSHGSLIWNGSNDPLWIPIDATADARPPREILVRIQHRRGDGGGLSSIRVGSTDALGWRYRTRSWLQSDLPMMSAAAFLAVGIFSLFVWIKRRHEQIYLLLFALAVISYIRTLHYVVGPQRLPFSEEWFSWLTINSMFWAVAIMHLLLVRLHQRSQPWLTWSVFSLPVVSSLLTLPMFASLPSAEIISAAIVYTASVWNSWMARLPATLLLAGWNLLGFLLGVYDWLLFVNLVNIEGAYLWPCYNAGVFFICCYIMFQRYVGAIHHVERVNENLAERLQARETELAASYARLRDIEHREMLSQERQRLMQDMHDGLGSSLHGALRVVEGGRISEHEVAEVLKGCIDDLKLAIDSMEPVEADLLLLLATLRYRLQPRLESSGMQLRWEVADVPPLDWLDPRNCLHILRILQEAFTNIMKHTRATQIRVGTAVQAEGLLVTITDNGSGFDVQQALRAGGGKGLANQQRRADAIGGKILWNSGTAGTCVTLSLPLTRPSTPESRPLRAVPA